MANIVGDAFGSMLPSFSGGNVLNWAVVFGLILLFIGAVGTMGYFIYYFGKFNKKIVLFRSVGDELRPDFLDRAVFERIGNGGDYWCRLRKCKKIIPRPKKTISKNTYWFYEREDGEWINFIVENPHNKIIKAGVKLVDEDMRLQRLGIIKNLQERFNKVTFWQKWGGMIMSLIFVLIITVCLVVLFQKMTNAWTLASGMASAVKEMAVAVNNMATQTGSGVVPL